MDAPPIGRLVYVVNARLPTEKAHGVQIMKMCEAFAELGIRVTLLHPRRRQPPSLRGRDAFDFYGVPKTFELRSLPNLDVVLLERLLPSPAYRAAFAAHALLWGLVAALSARRLGGDIFYTRDIAIGYWLTRLNLPTIMEVHVIPEGRRRTLLRRIAPSPSLVAVAPLTSHGANRLMDLGFAERRIHVLPDGVDLRMFEDLPSNVDCRRMLGLPLDELIVGYVGRFETMGMEKGIDTLIEAVAHLRATGQPVPLLLCVGGPPEAVPAYCELAEGLGVRDRVRFEGPVPHGEVPSWIRACDVVTIPWPWTEFSAYYTSPMKLFEYMAAGVPVVASDLPAVKDVLHHDHNGWLVEPGNSRPLGDALATLLQDPDRRARLAGLARNQVTSLTWSKRAESIMRVTAVSMM